MPSEEKNNKSKKRKDSKTQLSTPLLWYDLMVHKKDICSLSAKDMEWTTEYKDLVKMIKSRWVCWLWLCLMLWLLLHLWQ